MDTTSQEKTCENCFYAEPSKRPEWPTCIHCIRADKDAHFEKNEKLYCFTPKKPKPKEPRRCKTCGNILKHKGESLYCDKISCWPIYSITMSEQPKKPAVPMFQDLPPEKRADLRKAGRKNCQFLGWCSKEWIDCDGDSNHFHHDTIYRLNPGYKEPSVDYERIAARQKEAYLMTEEPEKPTDWRPFGNPYFLMNNEKPKSIKENIMFKLISHFSLRRYMMLCMLYTTVKLGQVVNPLLFRAVNLIPFPDVEQVVDGKTLMVPLALETGDVWDTVLVWTIVAGVATAATFATIGYNKSCNWVFRNLEKKTA